MGIVERVDSSWANRSDMQPPGRGVISRYGGSALLVAALALYIVLVLVQIDRYPVYFFADEAISGVDAYSIAHTGADHTGKSFPLFFEGLGEYPLSLTVYLQVPLIAAFGKSVWAVRTATALLSLLGVLALYLTLRHVFDCRFAWFAPLLLALSPFWYLHSRTGFEYVPATAFFLLYLYFTARSLEGGLRFVVLAAVSAAASFYCYTPGRGWVVVATVLTTLALAPTHSALWRRWLLLVGLLAILLTPYVVLQITHPEIALRRLESAGYVNFAQLPVVEKVEHFGREYLRAVDPWFWFTWDGTPHEGPIQRHVIPELPLVPIWLAPFSLAGLVFCLSRLRRPETRIVFAFMLAVPVPASLLETNSHRCLPVGAFLVLFGGIGLDKVLSWLPARRLGRHGAVGALTAFLVAYAVWFSSYTRHESIRRYSDYGFFGLQMGAPQLFDWIGHNAERFTSVYLATNLFNTGDVFARFFLPQRALDKVVMSNLDEVCRGRLTWPEGAVFIFPEAFPVSTRSAGCPLDIRVLHTVNDPLGRPLMMAGTLTRERGFSGWAAENLAKVRSSVEETAMAYGDLVTVEHPRFDIGSLVDLFDDNPRTITRTQLVNPARYEIRFGTTRRLSRIGVVVANTTEADVTVTTAGPDGETFSKRQHYSRYRGDAETVLFPSALPTSASALTIEVKLTDQDEFGSVHLSGITWQ